MPCDPHAVSTRSLLLDATATATWPRPAEKVHHKRAPMQDTVRLRSEGSSHRAVTSLRCRKESTSVRIHNVRPTIEQGQRCSRSNTPLSLHMYKDITHSVYAHRAIWVHVFHAHGGRRDHGCPQREYLRRRQCELADSTSTRRGHCLLAELIMCSRAAHTHAHKIQRRRYKRKQHKT